VRHGPPEERVGLDRAAIPFGGKAVTHGVPGLLERLGEAIDAYGDQVRDVGRALQLRAAHVLVDGKELGIVGFRIHLQPPVVKVPSIDAGTGLEKHPCDEI